MVIKSILSRQKMSIPPGAMLNARLVRRASRRLVVLARYRRLSLDDVPILFANSFPKSGTHLLTQVLQGFKFLGPAVDSGLPAIVTFRGDTGEKRSLSEIERDLVRLRPADISYGHLHAETQIIDWLSADGMASYFILRDPRDVAVSHAYYIAGNQGDHVHHAHYQHLTSFDEQLKTSITGLPDTSAHFPHVGERFQPFLGWLSCPQVLTLRFEEFIQAPEQTLARVYQHAIQRGFPANFSPSEAARILSQNINPQRSPTFRHGKSGEWRNHFNADHIKLFKQVSGDLLQQLGYENNHDW